MKADVEVSGALEEMPVVNGIPVLQFTKVTNYTTFSAEYAVEDGDIIFHFFLPPELQSNSKEVRNYWEKKFPEALVGATLKVFIEPPRLKFDYVSDYGLDSWYFRAFGFGNVLDPSALCTKFFDQLDSDLDATKKT